MTDVSKSDIAMYGRAVRERWPISNAKRAQLINILFEVAESTESDTRARVSAAKVLVDMDKLNTVPASPAVHNHLHITSREHQDIEERRRILTERATRIGDDT